MTSSAPEPTARAQAAIFSLLDWATLDADRLYALLRLRAEVFVVEQDCAFQDLDDYDRVAWHLLGWQPAPGPFPGPGAAGRLLAYARLLPPGARYAEASVGRLVTAPAVRGTGLGRRLMTESLRQCRKRWPGPVRIGAQQRLRRFYESFGFCVDGAPYLEDGIAHVEMLLPQSPAGLY